MILVFSSITYALKAQKLLNTAGVSATLVRSPRVREVRGCGYGLVVDNELVSVARTVCSAAGIRILSMLDGEHR